MKNTLLIIGLIMMALPMLIAVIVTWKLVLGVLGVAFACFAGWGWYGMVKEVLEKLRKEKGDGGN